MGSPARDWEPRDTGGASGDSNWDLRRRTMYVGTVWAASAPGRCGTLGAGSRESGSRGHVPGHCGTTDEYGPGPNAGTGTEPKSQDSAQSMCPIGIAVPANQSPVQDRFPRNEQNNEIIMISSPPDDHLREISISLFVQFAVDQWREWNVADELAGKQATCLLFC